jgi:hypothetical protein
MAYNQRLFSTTSRILESNEEHPTSEILISTSIPSGRLTVLAYPMMGRKDLSQKRLERLSTKHRTAQLEPRRYRPQNAEVGE